MSILDGEEFVFGEQAEMAPVWGEPTAPLWAAGEGFMIVGPDGVGKTSIAQQLTVSRLGIRDELLSLNVARDDRPVLYLALDRPRQIARSLARMVTNDDRGILRDRLRVWKGPLPVDIGEEKSDPEFLLKLAQASGAGTLILDSLKDAAVKLSSDEVGGRVNRALQHVTAAGIELVALHHQRKGTSENNRPNKLADVYGSRWLTAGMGSVVVIWGEAGDTLVDLTHLKQPVEIIGPLTLIHDHERGRTSVEKQPSLEELIVATRRSGLAVAEAARQLYRTDDRNAVERARRKLEKLAGRDGFERRDDEDGTARYYSTELRLEVA